MFNQEVVTKQAMEDRIWELEQERDTFMEETGFDEIEDPAEWEESLAVWETHHEEGVEWRKLMDIVEEIGNADYIVAADHWVTYVEELLKDCGDIPTGMPWYVEIDWEATAKNVASDYGTVEIDGEDWYYSYH